MKTIDEISKNMTLPSGYVLLDYCLKKELKQSGIEDIKERKEKIQKLVSLEDQDYLTGCKTIELNTEIRYIKEKFNITKEDLK